MDILNLFSVNSNSDTVEGRGHNIVHGHFREKTEAENVVLDKRFARYCAMGQQRPQDVQHMVRPATIRIYQTVDEFFNNTPEERRKRAIAKLNADDLDALGLK